MNGKLGRACLTVLIGALISVSAVACGGDDEAAPKPKFSSSSAVPTVASSSPVVESSSADAETAEAFIKRWNDLSTQMQNLGDTSAFRRISVGCDACLSTADLVDEYYGAGGYVHTRGWNIKSIACKSSRPSRAECVAQIQNGITRYKKSSSSSEETFPAGPFAEYFRVVFTNNAWNMDYIAEQTQ